jgi:hemerythrin
MTIEWKPAYKIGNADIDAQHQGLFNLANAFLAASNKATLTACAMGMFRYTREHFNHEETLMRLVNYPSLAGHVQQHNDLIARLNDIAGNIANITLSKRDLESFLTDWLLGHIRMCDTKLAAYVKQLPR